MSKFRHFERYLNERALYGPLIESKPAHDLEMVVVIPAHDEPGLLKSLAALNECRLPAIPVEVIVVFNESEASPPELRAKQSQQRSRLQQWAETRTDDRLSFHFLHPAPLPKKHAGVGLARKIGMDEALRRLPPHGVILCFDADSLCDTNYLTEVYRHFSQQPKAQAASIHFEHPLEGDDYAPEIYSAIASYELHLRYFVEVQRWLGLPFAVQTIGSSMSVRAEAYQAQNGMNRRQAGEDFYFLHKYTGLSQEAFIEINTTRVIPSPRVSHRVPFGTGKAVGDLLSGSDEPLTYSPKTFQDLKAFVENVEATDLPPSIASFLESIHWPETLAEIRANTSSQAAFRTRFFRWFDAFKVMKFAHFARDRFYSNEPVLPAAEWLARTTFDNTRSALHDFRERQKNR